MLLFKAFFVLSTLGRKKGLELMLGNSLGQDKHSTCVWGVGSFQGQGFVGTISPYGGTGGLWRDRSGPGRFL